MVDLLRSRAWLAGHPSIQSLQEAGQNPLSSQADRAGHCPMEVSCPPARGIRESTAWRNAAAARSVEAHKPALPGSIRGDRALLLSCSREPVRY
jgi:hypothetical protein